MSGNCEEEKSEQNKSYPLDLAPKLTTIKPDGKGPLIIPGQSLRGMRLLAQTTPAGCAAGSTGTAIIAANIVPQGALIKQVDSNRTQIASIINATQALPQASGNVTIQRPGQITLATSLPVLGQASSTGATYHVPRGPAVVANLSAPRNNVATAIRAPLVVAQSNAQQSFVRPQRTPSPAQGPSWLTSGANNGSQMKGTPAVLTTPVRGTTITGIGSKPQIVARPQVVSTIRPTTILHSAIIGQGQLHSFKQAQGTSTIQALNTTVTLAAQVLPNRTQTLVYSTGNSPHFTAASRITAVTTTQQSQRQSTTTPRTMTQVTAGKFTVPVNVSQGTTRLVTPTGAVLTSGARISAIPTTQTVLGTSPARIVSTTQANVSLGRLTVTVTNPSSTNSSPILSQIRSSIAMHPVVATTNSNTPTRTLQTIQAQGTKVITQSTAGLQLTQVPSAIKTTNVTTTTRTINTQPTSIVTHRPGTLLSAQTIPLAKVFPHHGDAQQVVTPTNVFIQTPIISTTRRTSPGPTSLAQTSSVPTTTIATYSIASGTYFYDATANYSVARSFSQPISTFAITQASSQQQPKSTNISAQVHGVVSNQPVRFNPVMVVEQSRNQLQQFNTQEVNSENMQNVQASNKLNSSPRPSILRKRDHEGTPLKAAKNLIPALSNIQQQQHQPPQISPPLRPDSRNNGHGSGGSTTISATSSPGSADHNEDSMPHIPMNKEEEENRPPLEMSPRKKPRKQNLAGNDMDEHNDDMQFITERDIKKDQEDSDGINSDGPQDGAPESRRVPQLRKPASASLLNSYRQTWKTTHNHYLRYSDVKPKEERKPTIMDLANQHRVLDKVNGWKIHHLSTQMDDLADQEENVHNQLTELLKYTESKEHNTEFNRINELIKGNLQRIKIINDGMLEAKTQIMKIFDHKVHVADIISRCASKRNYKKREKS